MTTKKMDVWRTSPKDWGVRVLVAAMSSLLVAIIGPFATYEMFSFTERLLYWSALIMGFIIPATLMRAFVYRFTRGPLLLRDFIAAAIQAPLLGGVVWAINWYVMEFDVATIRALVEHVCVAVLIFSCPPLIRAYLRLRLRELQSEVAADEIKVPRTPQVADAKAPFLRRLPPEAQGMVVRVSADDHQVDVWTDRGEAKLRSRFGDVLEELEPFDGARIHRSHWVAFSEIDSVVPEGRRHAVYLVCGMKIPVSPSGLRTLNEAGFSVTDQPSASVLSKV